MNNQNKDKSYIPRKSSSSVHKDKLEYIQKQRLKLILSCAGFFCVIFSIFLFAVLSQPSQEAGGSADGSGVPETAPLITSGSSDVQRVPIICIDPGHGFDDPGAMSDNLGEFTESDITLSVGLILRDMLLELGFEVVMTHDTNAIPVSMEGEQYLFGLEKRMSYAKSQNPDFFISLHCDSYTADESVYGTRIYYIVKQNAKSENDEIKKAADCIHASLYPILENYKAPILKSMPEDDSYYVLKHAGVPAVLVEMGFISNKNDAARLLDPAFQEEIAQGMAQGILKFYNLK